MLAIYERYAFIVTLNSIVVWSVLFSLIFADV